MRKAAGAGKEYKSRPELWVYWEGSKSSARQTEVKKPQDMRNGGELPHAASFGQSHVADLTIWIQPALQIGFFRPRLSDRSAKTISTARFPIAELLTGGYLVVICKVIT